MDKNLAAIYIRSSKDRHDVSPDTQRRELTELAQRRGLTLIEEWCDVVQSGATEYRPGFQAMLAAIKAPGRRWTHLLMRDTSRLGRRTYIAEVFSYECQKRGIEVTYGTIPHETDAISRVILVQVFRAMDEVHSLMSKEKGLAGMAENVSAGYRAGGRAPIGYQLARIATGALRDGAAVNKSKLEPGPQAEAVATYLRERARGTPRQAAAAAACLALSSSTLIGVEWNALTYAGHTIWNVHREHVRGAGYQGGGKRRARADWHISRDTHPALITEAEAEIILARLESSDIGRAVSAAKARGSTYLLTEVLRTPAGRPWHGQGLRYYRHRGDTQEPPRTILCDVVDTAVLQQMTRDMASTEFVRGVIAETARLRKDDDSERLSRDLRAQIDAVEGEIKQLLRMAIHLENPKPILRQVDDLEARREALAGRLAIADQRLAERQALGEIDEPAVRAALGAMAERIADPDFRAGNLAEIKDLIASTIERVTLDPRDLSCRIHYRIVADMWVSMASPRGRARYPNLVYCIDFAIVPKRRRRAAAARAEAAGATAQAQEKRLAP